MQVTVERCEHGPQVGRQRGRPHQQAQACLEALACTLGVLKECLHLHAEFLQLCGGEPDLLDLQVKSPSTPGDAVGELSLFPAHGCVNAGEQEYDEACLLVGLGVPQQAEKVIYIDPCAVRAVLE